MYVFTLTGKDSRGRDRKGKDFVLNRRYHFKNGVLEVDDKDGPLVAQIMRFYNFVKVKQVGNLEAELAPVEDDVQATEAAQQEVEPEAPKAVGRSRRKAAE